jgi:hypothetical protein
MHEKAWSTLVVTVHRRPENSQVGMHFVHSWLRKRPYTLCKSCKGILDLQLSYSNLSALQFNFLEKTTVEQGHPEMISRRNALLRDVARRQAPDRAPALLAGPRRRGTAATAGPIAPALTSSPNTPSPRAARPRAERTDPRRPTNGSIAGQRPLLAIGATEPSTPSYPPSTTHARPPVVLASPPRLMVYKIESRSCSSRTTQSADAMGADAMELCSTLVSNTA